MGSGVEPLQTPVVARISTQTRPMVSLAACACFADPTSTRRLFFLSSTSKQPLVAFPLPGPFLASAGFQLGANTQVASQQQMQFSREQRAQRAQLGLFACSPLPPNNNGVVVHTAQPPRPFFVSQITQLLSLSNPNSGTASG